MNDEELKQKINENRRQVEIVRRKIEETPVDMRTYWRGESVKLLIERKRLNNVQREMAK